jgi:hypothetical protein
MSLEVPAMELGLLNESMISVIKGEVVSDKSQRLAHP